MNDVFASLKKDAASSCRIKKIKSAVHKKSLEAFSFVTFFEGCGGTILALQKKTEEVGSKGSCVVTGDAKNKRAGSV